MRRAPLGGDKTGFFRLPPVGAGVWIEFEHGDPEYPIWSGCWWGSQMEIPLKLVTPLPYKKLMIKTEGGNSVIIDDTPGIGGIILETSGGQKIAVSLKGIEISNGLGASIKLTGPKVSINSGALDVI